MSTVVSRDATPRLPSNRSIRVYRYSDLALPRYGRTLSFILTALRAGRRERPDVIVGLSPVGLIGAAWLSKLLGVPYIFYNDEIATGNERTSRVGRVFGHGLKCLERRANQYAAFTVTQDRLRGRFVSRANRIPTRSLRYLPNSRSGSARRRECYVLHDRVGCGHGEQLVLWMGAVSPGSGALELACDARTWPLGWRMVFQVRADEASPYLRDLQQCDGQGAIRVLTQMVSYDEIDDFAASASVGLGLYPDRGPNARYIGASSGRINHFLQNGVPCVVKDFKGLRWVEENGAGICVGGSAEVFGAARRIIADHPRYRRAALETFDRLLRFDTAFAEIADEMSCLLGEAGDWNRDVR